MIRRKEMRDAIPVVDGDLCTRCGECVAVCASELLVMTESGATPKDSGSCLACGHCVAVCPVAAITLTGVEPAEFVELLSEEEAAKVEQVRDLLRRRRSVRNYRDEQVPEEVIGQLIRDGALAPSAMNEQAWHFVVIRDPEHLRRIRGQIVKTISRLLKMLDRRINLIILRLMLGAASVNMLMEKRNTLRRLVEAHERGEDRILWNAPTLIVVHSPRDDDVVTESSHYAVANIMAMATAMGLGTCLIGFATEVAKRDRTLSEYLQVPDGHSVDAALVVGYPAVEYLRGVHRMEPPVEFV